MTELRYQNNCQCCNIKLTIKKDGRPISRLQANYCAYCWNHNHHLRPDIYANDRFIHDGFVHGGYL